MKPNSRIYTRYVFAFSLTSIIILLAAGIEADQDNLKQSIDRANAFIAKHHIGDTRQSCCHEPGDANDDGSFNVADAVFVINYIFLQGTKPPCPNAADINGDCRIDISDVVQMSGAATEPATPNPSFECAPDTCVYLGY